MEYLLYFTFLIGYLQCKTFTDDRWFDQITLLSPLAAESQCAGGLWAISDASIGSFTVSWRYNVATNTVQFVIQGQSCNGSLDWSSSICSMLGQAAASINVASTYIALGWSDTAPTMVSQRKTTSLTSSSFPYFCRRTWMWQFSIPVLKLFKIGNRIRWQRRCARLSLPLW